MNMAMWIVAGGLIGWVGFTLFRLNLARGLAVSMIIGVVGALLGGTMLGPLFLSVVHPGDFNPILLFTALASAAGLVIIGNMIYQRFGM